MMKDQTAVQIAAQHSPIQGHCFWGQYPQSLASPQAVAALEDAPDSQGYYRSRYDGKRYAKCVAQGQGVFADGTLFTAGEPYYFAVEPIGWWQVPKAEGTLLLAERILMASAYHSDVSCNDWHTSLVRRQVQQFALDAFDIRQFTRLAELPLDNNAEGLTVRVDGRDVLLQSDAMPWCRMPPSWDNVFVLSLAEYRALSQEAWGVFATDYALAQGAFCMPDGTSLGWLRTAVAPGRAAVFGYGADYQPQNTGAPVTRVLGIAPVVFMQ